MKTKFFIHRLVVTLLFIGYFIAIYRVFFAELSAKYANIQATTEPLTAWAYASQATRLNPYEQNYHVLFLKTQILANYGDKNAHEKVIQKTQELENRDVVVKRDLIPLKYFLAYEDLVGEKTLNDERLTDTRNYYAELKKTYPNDLGVFVTIAKYENRLNLRDDFAATVEQIRDMRADIVLWHEDLAY